MNVRCPHCRASIDVEPLSNEVQELHLDCPGCKTSFQVSLRGDDFALGPGENAAAPADDGLHPGRDDKTEPVTIPNRFLLWATVVATALAVALLGYFLIRERPYDRESMGTAQVTPVATVQTERLAPAEIPSTNLGSVLPTPVFTTLPDPTVPPVPVENLDLGAFRRQLGAFAPTELKALRPKLVSAVAATKTPPHDLEVMTAQVYAYLGGRESLKEWIQYAYQTAFRAAQREPKDVEAKKALLMALLAAGKPDEVLAPAREMFALHGDDPIFAMCLGSALVRRGSGEEGLGILTTAYHKHPDSFPLGEALAKAHLDAERYAEAETTARGLLEREPNDAVIGRLIGRAFEARKKWGELVLLYEPLATANPNDWQLRFSLGRAYRMLRQFDASRTQLDGILARTDLSLGVESRAQVNLERGKVEFDQDRFAQSVPFLERAYDLNKSDVPTVLYLAGTFYRNKEYDRAATKYGEALRLEPKNLKTERYLGMALLEQGEMAEAEKHLKAVVLQGEEDASLYYHLSRIREAAGDRSGAVAYLESALRKDPNYQNARVRLDKLLGRKGP